MRGSRLSQISNMFFYYGFRVTQCAMIYYQIALYVHSGSEAADEVLFALVRNVFHRVLGLRHEQRREYPCEHEQRENLQDVVDEPLQFFVQS
jgi:hypothetical protein